MNEEDHANLLHHKITPDDIYNKSGGELACYPFLLAISFPNTIVLPIYLADKFILWKDPEKALELGLSFEEPEECLYIW